MRRGSVCLLAIAMLLGTTTTARFAAVVESTGSGVYTEDFSTVAAKDFTRQVQWDVFNKRLSLMPVSGVSQADPAIAVDTTGGAFMVWSDLRDNNGGTGLWDIYAQYVDAQGNRRWPHDVRVNSESADGYQGVPAVAVDPSGNAIIAWMDYRGPDGVYVQKLSPDGRRLWAEDVMVNGNSYALWDLQSPAVAVRSDNVIYVAWQGNREGKWDDDIYLQRLTGTGGRVWASEVQVNRDSDPESRQISPALTVDASGNVYVSWTAIRDGMRHIFAQRIAPDGQHAWATDVQISTTGAKAGHSDIAVDRAGAVVVAWEADGTDEQKLICVHKINSLGTLVWATPQVVNRGTSESRAETPSVDTTADHSILVAWSDDRNGYDNDDIFMQKLASAGNVLWNQEVKINSQDTDFRWGAQRQADLAVGMDNTAFVVWIDEFAYNPDVMAQRLRMDGTPLWHVEVMVQDTSGRATQMLPAAAMNQNDEGIIVWQDCRLGNYNLYAQRLDKFGTRLWDASRIVNEPIGGIGQWDPTLAINQDGILFVSWLNDLGLYAQTMDVDGNRLWPNDLKLNSSPAHMAYAKAASAPDGSVYMTWLQERPGNSDIWDVLVQKLDTAGHRVWPVDRRINVGDYRLPELDHRASPSLAVDADGSAIVAWKGVVNHKQDVYLQRISGVGQVQWAQDIELNITPGDAYRHERLFAAAAYHHIVVVWNDSRDGDDNIYAHAFNLQGQPLWANDVRVNRDSADAEQGHPVVAIRPDDVAIIAWADHRTGMRNAFLQGLDIHGNHVWIDELCVNANERSWPVNLSITAQVSPTGMLVWNDDRDGVSSVYAQALPYGNAPAWSADVSMATAERTYVAHGEVQSVTVDETNQNIVHATLMVSATLNGGWLRYYLSNDGGTTWLSTLPGLPQEFRTMGSDLRWRIVFDTDPVWSRTPIVDSLQIYYSTSSGHGDIYEKPDDTCAQAQPIQVDGTAQTHTFHQAGDADWVWFDVISGTTYIVETYNLGTRANTVAEMYPTCDAPPAGTGRSFGNGYTFSFTADQTGRFYTKVYNHTPSVYGQDTDYTLSVRSVHPNAVAIVVAGHDSSNRDHDSITYAADRAYRVFLNAGLGKANVRYLAPQTNHDADGDGVNDVAGWSTPTNVRDAVQTWARERGVALGVPLYVYLVDHGVVDRFKADGDELIDQVTATNLNLWLSNLEATTGTDNVNVILDACYSGSFIDVTALGPATISGRNRVVIASTTSDWQAYGPPGGDGLYFSNAFFSGLENEQSLWASYLGARQAVESQGLLQQPWLDDNGDKRADSLDGTLASGRALRRVAMGGRAPLIEWLSASGGVIRAKVVDDSAWVGVKVEVFAPSYEPPAPDGSGTTRIVDVPVVTLADPDSDGLYEGTYTFADRGVYRLVAHAEDAEGNLALPQGVQVCVGCVYLPMALRNT
jgi:hypothetical protein